jgi:hypothetical protein
VTNFNPISNLKHFAHPAKGDNTVSFKSVQASIAKKEGVPAASAGAILANASRHASPAARRKNPRLNSAKGGMTPKTSAPMGTMGPQKMAASNMAPAMRSALSTGYGKLMKGKK